MKQSIMARKNELNDLDMMKGFSFVAFAEENPEAQTGSEPQSQPQATTINYEDLISRARKEEKEKLYPKIQKLEADNKVLVEKHNSALLEIGAKDVEIKELKSTIEQLKANNGVVDSEEVKSLKSDNKKLLKELEELKANLVNVEELEQSIRSEYDVKLYKEQKLREVGDSIIPELVMGNSKEEIDASVEVAKTRFNEITSKFVKTPTTKIPPVNVNTTKLNMKDLSAMDISKMSAQEWAEHRKLLGLK